ncbi:conserved hypothetical protein [Pyrobaculum aerophilum str. IM2]|uniref:Ribonuclease VapC3 n=2 Tax=Pyrobaculum aerophilum TaxID=13773 RepID=VAPC3_PYRAE|nr:MULTISPECIES: type II toxin-antitoxin system VapC family toxin [Pyrobaculum]Q8ZZP3.1 RecName: Full=Ribonuclease VapC3; Short=RNase VapC3; AltName: Full=Putative toxin VapC3 [Pyrobaculum aerophilum str. IM2]AAL62596.1 conserved hypothetical protein [Pyrobaculum aerophilum str. IM2]HII46654.1 type II toxin-antitoxin system VapC family toxin [Pyrobaculum aerophilum]
MKLVVDASAIAALYVPEERSEQAERAVSQAQELHTLDLAAYEVANDLWKHARRGLLREDEASNMLEELWEFFKALKVHSYAEVLKDAFALALKHGVTVYDAAYVALAEKIGGKLLTLDRQLAEKFPALVTP